VGFRDGRDLAPSYGAEPFVSVIVPVYNDAVRLARCLAALEIQTYPADCYEVIVVDNGSEIPITPAIGPLVHARFEREPRPGGNVARVTGTKRARGEILAFTDADCLPDPAWIASGVACFLQTPNCGLVGGHIEVFAETGVRTTVAEILSISMHLKQERFVQNGRWAVFANLFTSRQVIEAIGPMNPEILSSGEIEWGRRIQAAGYRLTYAPNAVVRHPARRTILQHCQRAVRLEFAWKQLREIAGIGVGVRFWVGQHLARPLRDTYRDVIRHPHLAPLQKAQATALSCLLILLRIVAYLMIQTGVKFDMRKNWG
jgi:hypothetical protein